MAGGLKHVDPHAKRGFFYRAFVRFLRTGPSRWLSKHVVWKLDPYVMRATNGRVGLGAMLPSALLETKRAKSGKLRHNGVLYFHDGDDVVIIASKLGAPEHPSWFYNAKANPEDVALNGEPFTAELVEDDDERQRLWGLADQVFPVYADYRARAAQTNRTIPILRLVPRNH